MIKFPSLANTSFEREIWKGNFGRIQFLFKLCCEQTLVWKTHRLANIAMQGDIQARKYRALVCSKPLLEHTIGQDQNNFKLSVSV